MALTGNHVPGDPGHASDHNLIDAAFQPWIAYVPVLSGGTWAIGNATTNCRYSVIGKTVCFQAEITIGSTTIIDPTAPPVLTLPLSMISGDNIAPYLGWVLAAGGSWATLWRTAGPTALGGYAIGAGGLLAPITSTVPTALAATDSIRLTGVYESA